VVERGGKGKGQKVIGSRKWIGISPREGGGGGEGGGRFPLGCGLYLVEKGERGEERSKASARLPSPGREKKKGGGKKKKRRKEKPPGRPFEPAAGKGKKGKKQGLDPRFLITRKGRGGKKKERGRERILDHKPTS